MPDQIQRLFGISRQDFLKTFFGREPLLAAQQVDPELLTWLPTTESFSSTLALLGEQSNSVKVAVDNRAVAPATFADGRLDLQSMWTQFYSGHSIIINNIYKVDKGTKQLVELLSLALGHSVQANAYLTPPNAAAFDTHYDTHDVIIIQVAGSKHWRIHALSPAVPLFPSEHAAPHLDPQVLEQGQFVDFHLMMGHALYVPRGRPHKVSTGDGASLHITFGLKPLSFADFLRFAIDLAEKESAPLRQHLGVDLLCDPEFVPDFAAASRTLAAIYSNGDFVQRVTQAARKQLLKHINSAPAVLFRQATSPIKIRWRDASYSEWRDQADGSVVLTNGIKATRLVSADAAVVAQLRSGMPLNVAADQPLPPSIHNLLALGLLETCHEDPYA